MNYQDVIDQVRIDMKVYESKILARASVDLVSPPVIIKGFTVKRNEKTNQVFVSAPSYKSLYKMCPIVWMPKELFVMLSSRLLAEYAKMTGEDISIDEIEIDDIHL